MNKSRHLIKLWALVLVVLMCVSAKVLNAKSGVVLKGGKGPGRGKHIVFVIGDDEYRSEDLMPQLAKILAVRQGFKCTMLFATNKETGEIDPVKLHDPVSEVFKHPPDDSVFSGVDLNANLFFVFRINISSSIGKNLSVRKLNPVSELIQIISLHVFVQEYVIDFFSVIFWMG